VSAEPGLCRTCRHASQITSAKQSTFVLCGLSRTAPSFPKYPRLPVLRCDGYRPPATTLEDQGHQR
jgi:hypothetical protein